MTDTAKGFAVFSEDEGQPLGFFQELKDAEAVAQSGGTIAHITREHYECEVQDWREWCEGD